jgi:hypothetical protein
MLIAPWTLVFVACTGRIDSALGSPDTQDYKCGQSLRTKEK